ncbi:MAG: hypothetical protein C5B55_09800 [Blastocatellia bacterium]|nr:MAG: hypothetical protein C5B55_09800 [Blastocatellia bacterium]
MESLLTLRVILDNPPAGIDFGIQSGSGNDYETIQKRRSRGDSLVFEFEVSVKDNRSDGQPNFLGPITQGAPTKRFVYIDIGRYAGQTGTECARRLKVPLVGITWPMIKAGSVETHLQGTGRDGGPTCGTAKDVSWKSH